MLKPFPVSLKFQSKIISKDFVKTLRQISFFSGGNFLAQLIMIVYAILVARSLNPDQLGIYSGLYANLGISITIVNFGLDIWLLKETRLHSSLKELTGNILTIKLILGTLWCILCLILLPTIRPNIFPHFLVLIAIIDVFSESLLSTVLAALNIQRKIGHINITLFLTKFGKIFLLLLLMQADLVSHVTIISSRSIISFSVMLMSIMIVRPLIKSTKVSSIIQMLKKSLDFGLSEILAVIYGNIDVAILTFYSISDTGYYSPATGIIHALFIIPNSIYVFLLPKVANNKSLNDKISLRKLTFKVSLLFGIIGLILSLGLYISGEFVVNLILGQKYLFTGQLLTLLSPILFLKSLSFGFAMIIIISGYQRKRLIPQALVSIVNITLCVLFIPIYGVISVSWIYIISEIILLIGYGYVVTELLLNNSKGEKQRS